MKLRRKLPGRNPALKKPIGYSWSRPISLEPKSVSRLSDRATTSRRPADNTESDRGMPTNFTNKNAISRNPRVSNVNLSTTKKISFRFQPKHLPTIIFSIVILVGLLYASSVDSHVRVALPSGNLASNIILQPPEVYGRTAQSLIDKSLLNKSKITINTDAIASQMQAIYPELKNVVVVLPILSRRPIIQLSANPAALVLISHNQSTIIGDDGRALLPAKNATSSNLNVLPNVYDDSDLSIEIGSVAVPIDTIGFINELIHQMKVKNLTINKLVMPKAVYEIDVYLARSNYYIKFNSLLAARTQAGTFFAILEKISSGALTAPKEYIDVRVGDRAYLK